MAIKYTWPSNMKKKVKDFLKTEFAWNQQWLDTNIKEFEDTQSFSKWLEKKFKSYMDTAKTDTWVEKTWVDVSWVDKTKTWKGLIPKTELKTELTDLEQEQQQEWLKTDEVTDTTTELTGGEDLSLDNLNNKLTDLQNKQKEEWLKADDYRAINNQIEYYQDIKTSKERNEADRKRTEEMQSITWEISDIQSSQRIRKAADQVKALKQNLWYIGTMWSPWVSQQKLSAVENQIEEADKTYQELVSVENLYKRAQKLWNKSQIIRFERQMEDLQDSLDNSVNQTIQNALADLTQKEISQVIEDPEEMEKIRMDLLNDLDKNIADITEANFRKRQYVIDQMTDIVNDEKTREANKGKINPDLSKINTYYTDMNWDPIISATTGQRIDIPTDAPMDPIFDKDTGNFITFSLDETWNIVPQLQQVYDTPTFEESAIQNYANLVSQWKIWFDDVPDGVRNTDSFIQAMTTTSTQEEAPEVETIIWPDGEEYSAIWNKEKQKYERVWETPTDISDMKWVNNIVDFSTSLRGRENLQCWELVNDYWTQTTWNRAWMWDTLDSKLQAISKIWVSDDPVVWGLMVSNPLWNDVWHTWIVQAVNADGSIDVLEANAEWLADGQAPVIRTYSADDLSKMQFSKSPTEEEAEYSKDVSDIGQNILKGKSKLSDITWDPELKKQVQSYIANNKPIYTKDEPIIRWLQDSYDTLASIVDWEEWWITDTSNESLAEDVSGGIQFSPWDSLTWKKQQFLRKVQFILDDQTLQQLIDIKAQGWTFGALSEKELTMLQKSSSLLNSAANRDEAWNITWFTMDEKEFKDTLKWLVEHYDKSIKNLTWAEEQTWGRIKWGATTGGRIK